MEGRRDSTRNEDHRAGKGEEVKSAWKAGQHFGMES